MSSIANRFPRLTFVSILLLGLCLFAPLAGAQESWVPVYHPELEISRARGAIEIDGVLGDAGWEGAARADNFAEHSPGDQTQPEVDTEVLVTYDDDNLYVAWICYDDPAEIRASLCERDQIFSGDYVILCLDAFGEATHAYEIAANPYGIPGDLLYSSSGGEDGTYDMVFESDGRITEDGWVVEMAIPFASMRFPKRDEQVWRMDFWRNRPRESRFQYSWAAYDGNESCWPCKWGTVTGISGVEPGAGLELLPSVVGSQRGWRDDEGMFTNDDIEAQVGLGLTYDISSELSTELTLNPDFSQIESDADQIDVNSTFALFYPERRPFFQEGSDLFDTYFEAVYTRSINDPIAAGKLTGRQGSNSVAFLTARDEHSVIIAPFEEESEFLENGKSVSNILRAKHDLGEQSHVGMIATDRRFDDGGSGSLFGVDSRIRLGRSDALRLQVLATHTEEVDNLALADSAFNATTFDDGKYTAGFDGESFWGHAAVVSLTRDTRNYWGGLEYWERSPTFRADNGFEPSNNVHLGKAWVGGIKRFEEGILENINGSLNLAQEYNFDRVKKDEWADLSFEIKFRAAQTGIHSRYLRSNELFGGIQFDDIWQAHTCLHSQPSDLLEFGGSLNYGHRVARYDLVMGKEFQWSLWADLRPTERFLIMASFSYINSDDLDTGENLFSQSIFRAHLTYQFSRELSARLILQYNDRRNVWDADPLMTYRLNPFTVFYLGTSRQYRDLTTEEDGRDGWALTDRQYFLKLQYLFQP